MTIDEFVARALVVPHVPGASGWASADCWGIVEMFYAHVLGVQITDRGSIAPGNDGMQQGVEAAQEWEEIPEPENHCLVIMRAGRLEFGHVGIFIDGFVLHSTEKTGCTYQKITDRRVEPKITAYLRRK